jgi:stage IV sporulation protein FB
MPWSITIARVAGSEIRIHLTFFLLLAFVGFDDYQQGGAAAALRGIVLIVAVFACVVLHEFGHALAARRYGIKTPDITVLPIGGLARLSRMPDRPTEEIVIALAGPLVNVVIAAVLFVALGASVDAGVVRHIGDPAYSLVAQVAASNVVLVLFNLIPAFPMDGGRVLRALLALRLDRRRATEIAARIGQGFAVLMALWGLYTGQIFLMLIGFFVFVAARGESGDAGLMESARHVPVDNAMIRAFERLGPQASVDDAADALLRTTQHEFPIVDGGGFLRGILTRDAMISAMKSRGPATPVIEVMTKAVPTIRSGQSLDLGIRLMRDNQSPFLGVIDDNGRLVGYVNRENLAEMMALGAAGRKERVAR